MSPDLKTQLHEQLRTQRQAIRTKVQGLSEYDARLPRTPTGTNLLGLLKHVACCELGYFGVTFGRPAPHLPFPWDAPGVDPEDDTDLFATEDESMSEVLEWVRGCFAHADETISALPIDAEGSVPWWRDGNVVTLGQILGHMLQEEARHAGHADILREQVDGLTGYRGVGDNLPEWHEGRWREHHARLVRIAEAHR